MKQTIENSETLAEIIQDAIKAEPTKAPTSAPKTPPEDTAKIPVALSIGSIIIACVACVFAIFGYQKAATPITLLENSSDGNSAEFTEGSIADVASKVSSSVVSIVTEINGSDFFGRNTSSSAAGTGVIVSADGYILTNKHVIEDATSASVVLDDGTVYDAVTVVATDPLNDIAFLKIADVDNLSAAKLGDSKTISIGQQVVAIGNALGQYQNTVTSGIISGTGRSITAANSNGTAAETLSDMIQTDAAINSGNSGGPLVNAAGEVVGINTATSSEAEGIGFAIPISSIKGMLKSLLATGSAKRAYLGVYYVSITPEVAKSYNLPVTAGAYVFNSANYSAIIAGSPAEKAGLKDKDIITAINGVKVGSARSVSSIIGEYQSGDSVQFNILRGKEETTLVVTLGEYQED